MTIKELYELACEKGYENAEVGLNVVDFDNEPEGYSYAEVVKSTDVIFDYLYNTRNAEKICPCIWLTNPASVSKPSEVVYEVPVRLEIVEKDIDEYGDFGSEYVYHEYYLGDKYRLSEIEQVLQEDWYSSDVLSCLPDDLSSKIEDISLHLLERDELMYCKFICSVSEDFTKEDSRNLLDWISGQCSDGFGEGFEQRPVHCSNEEEVYLQLWYSDPDTWSIVEK